MTQSEFLKFVHLNMNQLHKMVVGQSPDHVMMLKNELQKAMTSYAKGKQGGFDDIQAKSVAMMMKLEKWIKAAFIEKAMKRLKKDYPNFTEAGIKSAAREDWEIYNREMSY